MSLTIHELLLRRVLPRLNLISGSNGLNNEIHSINSAELLHDESCFHSGDLIFTTGYDICDSESYRTLLPKLVQQGISGIVLQTGRYQETVPPYFVSLSNQLGLPVLTIPCSVSLSEILFALFPLLSRPQHNILDDHTISSAKSFFQQCLKEYGDKLFLDLDNQRIRLIFLEATAPSAVDQVVLQKSFLQIRSFVQAACHFCMWTSLSENCYAFIAAHSREDSPSMMYRLHLQFVALAQETGINYLLGNDYLTAPEQLESTIQRAAEGLHTLHLTEAKRGVCTYESIRFIRMLSYLRRDDSSIFLENHALKSLLLYDKKNHTHYMDTLRIYLSSNCNLSRTSKVLFIHRNTLINRLDKISSISGLRMEDYYARIHISIALMFHDYFAP